MKQRVIIFVDYQNVVKRTIFDLSVDRNLPKLAQHELSSGLFAASNA